MNRKDGAKYLKDGGQISILGCKLLLSLSSMLCHTRLKSILNLLCHSPARAFKCRVHVFET